MASTWSTKVSFCYLCKPVNQFCQRMQVSSVKRASKSWHTIPMNHLVDKLSTCIAVASVTLLQYKWDPEQTWQNWDWKKNFIMYYVYKFESHKTGYIDKEFLLVCMFTAAFNIQTTSDLWVLQSTICWLWSFILWRIQVCILQELQWQSAGITRLWQKESKPASTQTPLKQFKGKKMAKWYTFDISFLSKYYQTCNLNHQLLTVNQLWISIEGYHSDREMLLLWPILQQRLWQMDIIWVHP